MKLFKEGKTTAESVLPEIIDDSRSFSGKYLSFSRNERKILRTLEFVTCCTRVENMW